ncbi:xanthine dehydrogenase family protein molybdopterin-binding subunit [Rhodoplanes sp. Z2-YC6860]|uniref:xanthine dehydrogenase family protein molybdopterin-binding subunit n=1 Tax=Rhodoplanes sp. Z2-YC6860 TaxID=674703 RepID=UPI00078EF589|nr:molybdopterin cofactor-binding domain-containing protein [Rhodoplanes sp. Z2-YC6860]AMN43480.1 Isoquinoline 1-oxidoreductase [Rhodoplanes sp. Z2-YC6860]
MNRQINRRDFLGTGAAGLALTLTLAADPLKLGSQAWADVPFAPNVWLTIAPDGIITIVSPASELGQGTSTTLPAVLADELDADWSKVNLITPPDWNDATHGNPGWGHNFNTTSSLATRGYFKAMRLAGAQARRVLLDAAADKWGVPVAELSTEPSAVLHERSKRRLSYGEIAAFAKAPAELPKIAESDLKQPAAFRYIGKDLPRRDVAAKTTGSAKYGIDVQVPGMVYAAVLHSPYQGGEPDTIEDTAARAIPGVSDIVKIPGGVAVIGNSVEATQAAKNRLKATWTAAPAGRLDSERGLDDYIAIARDKNREGTPWRPAGDAKMAMQNASTVFHSEVYRTRYVYHGQMEPMNATVSVSPDGKAAEVWAGTQSPSLLLNEVAAALQIPRANITFHQHTVGGGYGRRGGPQDAIVEAALISKSVGKPVKLIWSREDDIAMGRFRPMSAHYMEAGFDADGKLIAWHHRIVAESVSGFRAALTGGKPPKNDLIVMKGSPIPHYPIPNKLAEHVVEARGARIHSLRGVGVGCNAFAIESFLDEIATSQRKDPLEFRLALTEGAPRAQALLRTVAEMSDWTRRRNGTALGLAMMEKDETVAVGVAEVSLDRQSGKIKVHNIWAAIDAGLAVQPANLAYQTEGSIVFGLGHLLREKITIRNGRVQETNFTDYEVPRMSDVPNIEVRVISTDNPPTGGGEDGQPLVAGAVGNAIARLTGVRLRELPFSPERVKGALNA